MGFTRTRVVVAVASAISLNTVFLGVSILFLFFPVAAVTRFLYPCLSTIEEEKSLDSIVEPVVEGDVIRLAGGLFLSFVVASSGLIVPLLPCCHCENGENQKQLRGALLRTLLLLQGCLGLALVGTGLLNLASSVENDDYSDDGGGNSTEATRAQQNKSPVHHARCSSLMDQNVLWLGVGTVVLTSVVMMTSFWPDQRSTEDQFEPHRRPSEGRRCCLRRNRQAVPDVISIVDPLLPDDSSRENERMDEARSIEDPEIDGRSDTEQTSRLQGTMRVLKLAGSESLYLWVGVAVLLVRLPFSLAIFDQSPGSGLWRDGKLYESYKLWNYGPGLTSRNKGEDLTWFFRFSVEATVRIVGISTYMLIRSPILGGCTLAIVPLVGIANKLYGDFLAENAKGIQSALAESTSVAHETLGSIKTVLTLACEKHEISKYRKKIDRFYDLNMKQVIASGVYFMLVSTFIINTCVQSALLMLGSLFVQQGRMTADVLLSFMLYQGQLQEYTLNLFQSFSSLVKSSGAGDRIFYLLDRKPPPPATASLLVKAQEQDSSDGVRAGEDITLDNVSFAYPTRKHVLALDAITLNVQKGHVVALVGASGWFGGVDLRSLNLSLHRQNIGMVTQEPTLFSGTIQENIAYGTSASLEDVVVASKIAHAHAFIEDFPKQYQEQVGERGGRLSGGQRQRICIARAIVRKPKLLLLDEATSALDPEAERAVQEALNELLRNRHGMTTIIIAHRLQTVRNADSIFVLHKGKVVENGSHNELQRASRSSLETAPVNPPSALLPTYVVLPLLEIFGQIVLSALISIRETQQYIRVRCRWGRMLSASVGAVAWFDCARLDFT
ncbi:hypothetical protein THAOC_35654 [Thalassiosira oceanica]|uniref:ABC transmembrane type-1 domain-containing protein n=1 Tax=Thalassiosira oceanica TaxID=159749 RepID=K0R9X7_THAOC|nr:hypothetical protein THAOC_35654 [Thalassiosira oceanica]|eukprot:EJK45716.1 hypothetical protein THAOC_35654 [Thalassiosira oceanica]